MAATAAATTAANNNGNSNRAQPNNADTRMTIDIRVFLAVIVCSMTLSFCVGVGIIGGGGGSASLMATTSSSSVLPNQEKQNVELPKVTSVNMAPTADSNADKAQEVGGDEEVHEPAGQVR